MRKRASPSFGGGDIVRFLVSGVLYTVLVGLLAWFFPLLIGLSKQDLYEILALVRWTWRRGGGAGGAGGRALGPYTGVVGANGRARMNCGASARRVDSESREETRKLEACMT